MIIGPLNIRLLQSIKQRTFQSLVLISQYAYFSLQILPLTSVDCVFIFLSTDDYSWMAAFIVIFDGGCIHMGSWEIQVGFAVVIVMVEHFGVLDCWYIFELVYLLFQPLDYKTDVVCVSVCQLGGYLLGWVFCYLHLFVEKFLFLLDSL